MTVSLALKLVLTPVLIASASLAARRWGAHVAGWLAGFPFTSAPVAVILTIDHGVHFTAGAAAATLLGVVSQAAYAAAYILAARRLGWPWCVGIATLAFVACTALFARLAGPATANAALVAAALTAALLLLPDRATAPAALRPPLWDLPARMLVATAFVVALTSAAASVGPTLTGLVTPFPLYATVLGVFAHLQEGPRSAAAVMRGLLVGLYGFAAFFLVLALLVIPAGPVAGFAAAVVSVFAVQLAALAVTRRGRGVPGRARGAAGGQGT